MTEFMYEGKCNNCGRLNRRMAIPVLEDRGDGAHTARFVLIVLRLYSTQVYNVSAKKLLLPVSRLADSDDTFLGGGLS